MNIVINFANRRGRHTSHPSSRAPIGSLTTGLITLLATALVTAGLLSGCASISADEASGPSGISVVASTNVYGDIVEQIAGSAVTIRALIASPDQDPHSYEANAQDELALAKADIIVENGGGYDPFVDTMRKAIGHRDTTVINVVALSGHAAPADGDLNEHVWYDVASIKRLTVRLVSALSRADPTDAAAFTANATRFSAGLTGLQRTEAAIKSAHAGDGVAITEPVPLYLLAACGLVNKTPEQFSAAVEEGNDVSPALLKQTLDLFSSGAVRALVYNEQTSGPETQLVHNAARSHHIPSVAVTETLPAGKTYLTWMAANLDAISRALA